MTSSLSLSLRRYGPGAVQPDHAHHSGSVSIVIGGGVEEEVGGRRAQGRIGDMVVKPPGIVHRDRFGPRGAILVSIGAPPQSVFDRGWRWCGGTAFARRGVAVAMALRQGDPFGAAEDGAWTLLDLAQGRDPLPRESAIPLWLRDVRDAVAAHPSRPSVRRLAERANVHPVYLTRAFRKAFGRSISGFIRKLRVERGAELLAGSELNVGAIAATLGFADQSHFCRAFRVELGLSPSAYRSVTRG